MSEPQPLEKIGATVKIVDDERKVIRSVLKIRVDEAYDALEELELLLSGFVVTTKVTKGTEMKVDEGTGELVPVERPVKRAVKQRAFDPRLLLEKGNRELLMQKFREAQLATGLGDFILTEFQWASNTSAPRSTLETEGKGGQTIIVNSQPQQEQKRVGFFEHVGAALENITKGLAIVKTTEKPIMVQLRESKTPMEKASLLGRAALSIDAWMVRRAFHYYDSYDTPSIKEYFVNETIALLKQWIDAAMDVVKAADHFLNHRMLHLEHEIAKAEAAAVGAALSQPKPQEVPRPTA